MAPRSSYVDTTDGSKTLKITSTDKVMYAARSNPVRYTIGSMNSTGIKENKVKGDPVIGAEFITLEEKLNGGKVIY